MKKKLKIIFISILIIILLGIFFIYQTHKSQDIELSQKDIEIKQILNDDDYKVEVGGKNITKKNIETKKIELEILKLGKFNPNATDSDSLHRGSGDIKIISYNNSNKIILGENFKVTNGPNYRLYLLNEKNIETEKDFLEIKENSYNIIRIKQFSGYQSFDIPNDVDISKINSALIWCESFSQFITSGNLE